jgi:hypothetical protein
MTRNPWRSPSWATSKHHSLPGKPIQFIYMKKVFIASFALWLATVACFSLLEMGDSRREIVGGYCTISGSSITLMGIVECKDTAYEILPNVTGMDWNDEFIVVKRDNDDFNYGREEDLPGGLEWYIIDVKNHVVWGPYLYDAYLNKRDELSVPSELNLLEE